MPETTEIPTLTTLSFDAAMVEIKTVWDTQIPIMYAFISPVDQEVEGELFRMGDLGIYIEDAFYPAQVDFTVDENGDLIANGELAGNFSINEDGELIFTQNMATLNLGLVKGLFSQTTPPTRTDVNWLDTSLNPAQLKTYDSETEAWLPLIYREQVELEGAEFTRPEFTDLTLSQIQQTFRLYVDGNELITRRATELAGENTINLGYAYTGHAFFVKLGSI